MDQPDEFRLSLGQDSLKSGRISSVFTFTGFASTSETQFGSGPVGVQDFEPQLVVQLQSAINCDHEDDLSASNHVSRGW